MNNKILLNMSDLYVERESDITCNKWYWTFLPIRVAHTRYDMEQKILEYFKNGIKEMSKKEQERTDEP